MESHTCHKLPFNFQQSCFFSFTSCVSRVEFSLKLFIIHLNVSLCCFQQPKTFDKQSVSDEIIQCGDDNLVVTSNIFFFAFSSVSKMTLLFIFLHVITSIMSYALVGLINNVHSIFNGQRDRKQPNDNGNLSIIHISMHV